MQMSELKDRRQRIVADLISSRALSSQEELADLLSAQGFAVTQATVSRDLEQLGAVKVRRDGRFSYALSQDAQGTPASRLAGVLHDFVNSMMTAMNLLVIKTPPGSAHLIGVLLDQSDFPEIVGTICGDDTIFIACNSERTARSAPRKVAVSRKPLTQFLSRLSKTS